MLEKMKSYFIILLILSLSFVPSVNASSDIFDEPRHVDYETYKNRMVEYIETPDYLKASMPPIIGRGEYIDSTDIFLAVDDLLTVIPVINNDTFNQVKNTPFFKNTNSLIVETVKKLMVPDVVPVNGIEPYLTPYFEDPVFSTQASVYNGYKQIAQKIKDIVHDTLILDGMQPTLDNDFDGVTFKAGNNARFTIPELFDRINSAKILPDGYYHLTDSRPLESRDFVPNTISVESVAYYMDNQMIVSKPGVEAFNKMNDALLRGKETPMETNIMQNPLFKNSENGRYPSVLLNKYNTKGGILTTDDLGKDQIITNSMRLDNQGHQRIIEHDMVKNNCEELGLTVTPEGLVVGRKLINEKQFDNTLGVIEGGFMFIFAIITLILAFVYR
jgi:hypothetical protein